MASAGIRVVGASRLRRTLKAAGDDLGRLKAAHGRTSQIVVAASRSRAPRRTGRLAGSARGSGTNTVATVRAGGARVPYAAPIHWGWPSRGIAAQPWLSEAAKASEPVWTHTYEDAVKQVLSTIKGA